MELLKGLKNVMGASGVIPPVNASITLSWQTLWVLIAYVHLDLNWTELSVTNSAVLNLPQQKNALILTS